MEKVNEREKPREVRESWFSSALKHSSSVKYTKSKRKKNMVPVQTTQRIPNLMKNS